MNNFKLWIYKHYKNKKLYELICYWCNSDTWEKMVIYKPLYNDSELIKKYWKDFCFVRLESIFFQIVEFNWHKIPRFEYIWNKNYKII